MGKRIVSAGLTRKEASEQAKRLSENLKKRGIKREAYATPLSYGYLRTLTRKGYPILKKESFGVAVRDKIKKNRRKK